MISYIHTFYIGSLDIIFVFKNQSDIRMSNIQELVSYCLNLVVDVFLHVSIILISRRKQQSDIRMWVKYSR